MSRTLNQTTNDCPWCGNELLADDEDPDDVRFYCGNCARVFEGRLEEDENGVAYIVER